MVEYYFALPGCKSREIIIHTTALRNTYLKYLCPAVNSINSDSAIIGDIF